MSQPFEGAIQPQSEPAASPPASSPDALIEDLALTVSDPDASQVKGGKVLDKTSPD